MMSCIRNTVRIAAISLFLLPAWQGAAQSFDAEFEFKVAGVPVGKMVTRGSQNGSDYSAAAEISPSRLVGTFVKYFFDGSSQGEVRGGGTVVPVAYTAESQSPRARRETRIDWQNGVPVFASVEPPRSSSLVLKEQGGTLDPVTAGYFLLRDAPAGEVCNASVDIFDGSRRSRIELGRPQDEDGELICNGRYKRLQGEAATFSATSEYPFRVTFLVSGDGTAKFQKLETPTKYGNAVLERR